MEWDNGRPYITNRMILQILIAGPMHTLNAAAACHTVQHTNTRTSFDSSRYNTLNASSRV